MAEFSDGFAEPILWGACEGYTIAEIAAGLGIDQWVIVEVIESRSPVRFPVATRSQMRSTDIFKAPVRKPVPMLLSKPAKIDPSRTDPAYLAWARSRQGASQLLGAQA